MALNLPEGYEDLDRGSVRVVAARLDLEEMTGLLCGASAVFAINRFYWTLKNIQGYLDPDYDTWDAGADIIDPTRVGRDSVFPWTKEVYRGTVNTLGSSYGKLRSSTMDIAFPEFTIPEFTLD